MWPLDLQVVDHLGQFLGRGVSEWMLDDPAARGAVRVVLQRHAGPGVLVDQRFGQRARNHSAALAAAVAAIAVPRLLKDRKHGCGAHRYLSFKSLSQKSCFVETA